MSRSNKINRDAARSSLKIVLHNFDRKKVINKWKRFLAIARVRYRVYTVWCLHGSLVSWQFIKEISRSTCHLYSRIAVRSRNGIFIYRERNNRFITGRCNNWMDVRNVCNVNLHEKQVDENKRCCDTRKP